MDHSTTGTAQSSKGRCPSPLSLLAALACSCAVSGGCASLTNPVADGIPVRQVPPELLAQPKEGEVTIPLSLLRQKPPDAYKLGPGDVLGIWIEGVLGTENQPIPVTFPEQGNLTPASGYPIPVQGDGTINLPFVAPVRVQGMTVEEVQETLRDLYVVKRKILRPGQERILVSLLRPRQYHVLVIRQDSSGQAMGAAPPPIGSRSIGFTVGPAAVGGPRRGMGFAVDLPAYENDVLNALALTGGLPGSDAVNEIVIQRGSFRGGPGRDALAQQLGADCDPALLMARAGGPSIRIPLRVRPGEVPSIRQEDIVLQTGDIVFIEARQADFYYTGGLLPPGEYVLPRDYDLDVVEAVLRVGGPLVSGGINPINITGQFVAGGIGFPNPSLLTVVRQTPGCGQTHIRVDLNRALRDSRERILLQKGDVLILQETPGEAMTRYFTQQFTFTQLSTVILSPRNRGTIAVDVP